MGFGLVIANYKTGNDLNQPRSISNLIGFNLKNGIF